MRSSEVELLLGHLQTARSALVWKLDGLSEYDVRRPMTPTGTNLLGLVKHMASVESEYFHDCMGRVPPFEMPWTADDSPDNADMWATPEESREYIVDLYRGVWAADDAVVRELGLDAEGFVPWWREDRRNATIRDLLVHLIAETSRHAGHADIVRELVDGAAGLREDGSNLPDRGPAWWREYVATLERAATQA